MAAGPPLSLALPVRSTSEHYQVRLSDGSIVTRPIAQLVAAPQPPPPAEETGPA